jgi:hypothetical protein
MQLIQAKKSTANFNLSSALPINKRVVAENAMQTASAESNQLI